MFDTVVVPLDGWEHAECALGPAEQLADRCGARMLLLTVYAGLPAVQNEDYLRTVAARMQVPTEIRFLADGQPGAQIANVAAQLPNAVICMGTAGRQGIDRLVLGSVASEVVRRQVGPVALVGPEFEPAPQPYDDLVVPLDGSFFGADVLPFACTLADRFSLRVHLVSAVPPSFVPSAHEAGMEAPEAMEANYVADLARKLHAEGVCVTWEVLHRDHPGPAIVDYVSELTAPLVVMTTHGRSGWSEAVLGSVANDVVHTCPAPTFLIKPRPPRS